MHPRPEYFLTPDAPLPRHFMSNSELNRYQRELVLDDAERGYPVALSILRPERAEQIIPTEHRNPQEA